MQVDGQDVAYLIEIRGVYDGWSVAVLEDGTRVYHSVARNRTGGGTDAFLVQVSSHGQAHV